MPPHGGMNPQARRIMPTPDRDAPPLARYRHMRDFAATPEPHGEREAAEGVTRAFTVQRHAARRLHFDFRLELGGVLRSWAVPKGPSLDPAERRLAVEVEDHPLEYGEFEGVIPEGQYGAGQVQLWDRGTWESQDADPAAALARGRLKFTLHGFKLHGAWTLVRMTERQDDERDERRREGGKAGHNWLLIKEKDAAARRGGAAEITDRIPGSVKSRVAEMTNASSRPLPEFIAPQLATLVAEPPKDEGWLYEIKYDGYRLLAKLAGGQATLYTRTGRDWTAKLPRLARRLASLRLDGSWLDGEIAVLDPDGIPDFQALQNAFERGTGADVVYYVFDAPWLSGQDLRALPLVERKQRLAAALAKAAAGGEVGYSEHFAGEPGHIDAALDQACRLGLEGLIGKQGDAPYVSERSRSWIKLKCRPRQEFVIGGYTDPGGSREGFGALLLGIYDASGALRYAGRVGSGFEHVMLARLGRRLAAMETKASPFEDPPKEPGLHWVQPTLVAEVTFSGWTRENLLRQASFIALREDKPATAVTREEARPLPAPTAFGEVGRTDSRVGGVRLTHPERLVWPESGITKSDLARYYESVAPWLMPHLSKRPLSLLRCPDGSAAECFFQKHLGRQRPVGVQDFAWEESSSGKRDYVYVETIEAVIGLVQRGIVEFHTWGSSLPAPGRPDRLTLDLDPDPELPWAQVVEGARLARVLFDEFGLACFLKTTGGKGLHLVAPLAGDYGWSEIKAFAKALAEHLARVVPQRFTANMAKSRRAGRIYVDYLRNDEGATAIAGYSTRARPGAPVSMPLAWDELSPTTSAAAFNLKTVPARLAGLGEDPWRGYAERAGAITAEMRRALGMSAR
jgi:bifunctional non-homologous end joining protein LigD